MFWQTSPCNFWSALYTITEICTIVWRRHTNTLLKFWNVSIRLTWLTIASNVLNRSFLAFHRGKLWQKNDFCQFFVVLHKITYDRATKLHGPSHQISKYTTIDQVEKCCKMLKKEQPKTRFFESTLSIRVFVMLYKIEHYRTTFLGRYNEVISTCSQND